MALIARTQLPLPVQSPLHAENFHPAGAVAVSVALSVRRKIAEHDAVAGFVQVPPLCNAGEKPTDPVPLIVKESVLVVGGGPD